MAPQEISNLFYALRDGEIRDLVRENGNLQFRVALPKLADQRGEGFQYFLCTLSGVRELTLQPFRNESTEIKDLSQINKLQLRIERAETGDGEWIRVFCGHKGSLTGARLSLKAEAMAVWDEAFDPLTVVELAMLRGSAAGK